MTHEEGEGRQMPTRYTPRGLIAMACWSAFCIACAVVIAIQEIR